MPHWSEQAQLTAVADLRDDPPGQTVARCEPPREPELRLLLWSEDRPEYWEREDEPELEFAAEAESASSGIEEAEPALEFAAEASSETESVGDADVDLEFAADGSTSDTAGSVPSTEDTLQGEIELTFDAAASETDTTAEDAEPELVFIAATATSGDVAIGSENSTASGTQLVAANEAASDAATAEEVELTFAADTIHESELASADDAEPELELEFTVHRDPVASARTDGAGATGNAFEPASEFEGDGEPVARAETDASDFELEFATGPSDPETECVWDLEFAGTESADDPTTTVTN